MTSEPARVKEAVITSVRYPVRSRHGGPHSPRSRAPAGTPRPAGPVVGRSDVLDSAPWRREEPAGPVAVIGAGMAGILSAIKLAEAGITDVSVFEKADRVGGTWRENTYPGLSCDVPSHLYSFSFALQPRMEPPVLPGPEIAAYFERVAKDHDVLTTGPIRRGGGGVHVLGGWLAPGQLHRVPRTRPTWSSPPRGCCTIEIPRHRGTRDVPGRDVPQLAVGPPGPAGRRPRRDHRYRFDRNPDRLGDRRPGGDTVPLPEDRTVDHADGGSPPFTEPRADLRPPPERLRQVHQELSDLFDVFAHTVVDTGFSRARLGREGMPRQPQGERPRPRAAERLRPDYRAACKRLILSPDFYDTIQRPNAELVTKPIQRIEAGGIRTVDGHLHELDLLVLATGYKANAFMRPMRLTGRGGVSRSSRPGIHGRSPICRCGSPNSPTCSC